MAINFYVLDIETNGLMLKKHEICEVSIIRAQDRVQLTRRVKVERPEDSSFDALRIIGKTANELRYGIDKKTLVDEMNTFLNEDGSNPESRCIIGHNIAFDRKFLHYYWSLFNQRFPVDLFLDTMHLAKSYIKKNQIEGVKINLQAACDFMGVKKVAGMHEAEADTRNTYLLWKKLVDQVDYLEHIKRIPHKLKDDASDESETEY